MIKKKNPISETLLMLKYCQKTVYTILYEVN